MVWEVLVTYNNISSMEVISMLTIIFLLLMIVVFGKLIWFAIRAAWGITKVLFSIVFLPIVLIVLALSGLMVVALPILIIVGLAALFIPKQG